jgi:hypothetical protein
MIDQRSSRLTACLPETPVAIKRVDGTVAPLEVDPCIEKRCKFVIVAGNRIGQRYLDDPRFRHNDGYFG